MSRKSPAAKQRLSKQDFETLRGILLYVKPYRSVFTVAFVALFGASALNLLIPELVRRMVEPQTFPKVLNSPLLAVSVLLGIFASQAVLTFIRYYLFSCVGQRVLADVRRDLFAGLLHEDITFLDATQANDLTSRLINDAALVQEAVSVRLSVIIRYTAQVVIGVLCMAWLSWILTATSAAAILLLVMVSFVLTKGLRQRSRQQQDSVGETSVFASENITAIRLIRSLNAEAFAMRSFSRFVETIQTIAIVRSRYAGLFASGVSFLLYSILSVLLVFGIMLVHQGSLSISQLAAFVLYGAIVAGSFSFLISGYSELVQSLGGLSRVFELLKREKLRRCRNQSASDIDMEPRPRAVRVCLENVSFGYSPERPLVLDSVDITFEAGKTTALVGISGSGKSSLVSLLLGFYSPSHGRIVFESSENNVVSRENLVIGWSAQEPILFSLSIEENLRYAKPEATIAELEAVCEITGFLDVIRSLGEGFSALIGDRGIALSGGQRQRLAIARAVLRNPDILVLDEATSGLDSKSEDLISQRIREYLPKTTIILISHRLATIKRSDAIVVLDQGRVVQVGTHAELTNTIGLYREHAERQSLEA